MSEKPWHRHYDYNVPTTLRYPRLGAHEILGIPCKAYPDKAALNFYGSEMTFWELRDRAMRFANALEALGVHKGDRVGLHLPNCPQYVISYFAALSIGAVVVNLNPLYTPDELKHIAGTTGLSALITFDMVLPVVRALVSEVDIPVVIVTKVTDFIKGMEVSTAESLELEEKWHHFSTLIEGVASPKRSRVQVNPEDPALIQFTGGTTGVPKGAVLTHANLVAGTLQCSMWGNPTISLIPPERRNVVAVLPFFHVYGNIVVLNWATFCCATMILIPRFDIEEVMNILSGFEEITFFPAVPTMINAVINHPRAEELRLDRKLGLLNSGAAPMPVELIEKVKDMGIYFSEGYGLSESTALGIANPILGLKKAGSIGIPFPDNDVRLVDVEEGVEEVPRGEPGEIVMRGPLIMQGYWDNPEETAAQLREGWLHTGDIAIRDEDDYFFIVDRKKDMIISGGYNVYPREIDEVLFQHPKVAEAVAVGIPDEYRGETIKAFVVLKPGEEATAEEIISFCREKLAAYKVPRSVEFRSELPKSVVGKVLRKILREEEARKRKAEEQI
ncbi:long-chain fatty acid--CoA ligase [Candidatus Solincola tengchongensis]|uniref:long-chain-fatty-acid--CoA ligase n=1 Tax=Candidatus Solincola tengchongensis TaxID=2900693 RepID=UPI00257B4F5B|nr:long-chain fatty acid--CoA ligase [Candidatus Solincola tengchongensis]